MYFWTNHPFLRILIVFSLGILLSRFGIAFSPLNIVILLISFFLLILIGKSVIKKRSNLFWGQGLLVCIILIGNYRYTQSSQENRPANDWSKCQSYMAIIDSYPVDKSNHIIYEIMTSSFISEKSVINEKTRIQLYIDKNDSSGVIFNYGDKIQIEGRPLDIEKPKNPYAFDFSHYMADQHIYMQQFTSSFQVKIIKQHCGNPLLESIYRIRSYFEATIKSQIKGKQEQAIILALLIGIKGQLDDEIKTAYASAGAMHVLAVSGLHVSIIYFLLHWLFRGIPYRDFKRYVMPTLCIIVLWTYALLTGFSPSILRAVTMFSIVICSEILSRKRQIFNSLAFAAFLLLLYEPHFLFNVGFQLSFLAVVGIVFLYPKLYALWKIENWMFDYCWKITCVSLAAQMATFPLSIYYFNQFPTYFLLTNILVIPAAFLIMILGIVLLLFGNYAHWIGQTLEFSVFWLNKFMIRVDGIYGSVIEWVYFSLFQVLLIYLFYLCCIALFNTRKIYWARLILMIAGMFSLDSIVRIIDQSQKKELLFYSSNRNGFIDKITSLNASMYVLDSVDNMLTEKNKVSQFRIQNELPPLQRAYHPPNHLL